MERIFIVDRWEGSPEKDWYQWLANRLEKKAYQVHLLEMPHPEKPEIKEWVEHLSQAVGKLDEETHFIGHSIGCQTILRYLSTQKRKAGKVALVAGWATLQGLETKQEEEITLPWLTTPIDWDKAKYNLSEIIAIFSDNDPFVPLDNKDIFKAKLGAKIIVEHDRGHFTQDDGATELPIILNFFK